MMPHIPLHRVPFLARDARFVVSAIALSQGLAPLVIDCNRTHATNPLWPGHARFHLVWQVGSSVLFGLLELALVWWRGPLVSERFYLAAVLALIPLLGFVAALISRSRYGGTLHDPNGIAPVKLRLASRAVEVDLNAVLVISAIFLLLIAGIGYWLAS
jgi:hypothetical protein